MVGRMSTWQLLTTDDFDRCLKWYAKKRPRELQAVLDNLDTFQKALNAGAKPQQVKVGFLHPEPHGVLAVDRKGGGNNLQQTRLYLFPWEPTTTLYLLTLGDKRSQSADIEKCNAFVVHYRTELAQYEQTNFPKRDGDGQSADL